METKAQIKSRKFGEWLNTVINPIPVKQNNPILEGTGIEFFDFFYNDGVTVLHPAINYAVLKDIAEQSRSKYIINLKGKVAFYFRCVNGKSESPVLNPEFSKLVDDYGREVTYKTFGYINDWKNKLKLL